MNEGEFYICCYRRSARQARCITTVPDLALARSLMRSYNELEMANYRRARKRRQNKERPRPRLYFITSTRLYKGTKTAIRSFHRWAYWYYTPASV